MNRLKKLPDTDNEPLDWSRRQFLARIGAIVLAGGIVIGGVATNKDLKETVECLSGSGKTCVDVSELTESIIGK